MAYQMPTTVHFSCKYSCYKIIIIKWWNCVHKQDWRRLREKRVSLCEKRTRKGGEMIDERIKKLIQWNESLGYVQMIENQSNNQLFNGSPEA